MLGDVCFNTANQLHKSSIEEQIVDEISAVTGKTSDQSYAELSVTRKFLEKFFRRLDWFLAKGWLVITWDKFLMVLDGHMSVAIISPLISHLKYPCN